MANITLSIPDDVHAQMREHTEVRWSEVARKAIVDRLEREKMLHRMDELAKKSKLTSEDVRELSKKVNKAAAKRFLGEAHPGR